MDPDRPRAIPEHAEDERLLRQLGYSQELARRMTGFSNFAISLSIICILAGGITSFHVGLCSAGGASIGLGWPLACAFSMTVAATMAQVSSAFPTAGGLYHWGSILGGRAWGWVTAWFNLAGLVTVLAAINAGTFDFAASAFAIPVDSTRGFPVRSTTVVVMTLSQAALNHFGIRLTSRLTDLSGYLILAIASVLTVSLLAATPHLDASRLWTFSNFSGLPEASPAFPRQENLAWLFCLGLLLPAYTITGFDASAHTAEETVGAARNVPAGILRSVLISSVFGWFMIAAILLAMPEVREGATRGAEAVAWTLRTRLAPPLALALLAGIVITQYICGLAALTSGSRMMFAFARDGGLPASAWLRRIHPLHQTPAPAIWTTALSGIAFTLWVPYTTIAAVCTVFLYISYVLPVVAGWRAHGRTWTRMGPWHLGAWFRPLCLIAAAGCVFLLVIGMQPPNQQAATIVAAVVATLLVVWFGWESRRFKGPPNLPPS